MMTIPTNRHFTGDSTGGEGLSGLLSSWELAFEFILNGLHLLLLLKLFFTQGFTECKLIILESNGEEGTAFPATIRPIID